MFKGGDNMSNEYKDEIYKPQCEHTCPAKGFQDVLICVPVEVKPFAEVGKVKTECLGHPIIISCDKCEGRKHGICKFTISQKIRVEVPVIFGAKTEVGEAHIDCEHPKGEEEHCDSYNKEYTEGY